MKTLIISLTIILLIISCSSVDYTKFRQTEFNSNQDIELFYLSVPLILQDAGFKVEKPDMENGTLNAYISENGKFRLEMKIEFDNVKRHAKITTVNQIITGNNTFTEYYTIDDYNDNYEQYFLMALISIRSNATKTAFPNR